MPEAPERSAKVARQGPHIGALAAIRLDNTAVAVMRHDGQAVDLHGAGDQLGSLAVPCQIVGALTLDLDGREARRDLLDGSDKARQQSFDLMALGANIRGIDRLS